MVIVKRFGFIDTLRRSEDYDPEPLRDVEAMIYCHSNGLCFLEIDSETNQAIDWKLFKDSAAKLAPQEDEEFSIERILLEGGQGKFI